MRYQISKSLDHIGLDVCNNINLTNEVHLCLSYKRWKAAGDPADLIIIEKFKACLKMFMLEHFLQGACVCIT